MDYSVPNSKVVRYTEQEDQLIKEHKRLLDIIFERRYDVSAPNEATRSEEHIRLFGVRKSGDDVYDKHNINAMVRRLITINTMVEWYNDGVQLGLRTQDNVVSIYDILYRYFNVWLAYMDSKLWTTPPIDDLSKMNNFADAVYKFVLDYGLQDRFKETVDILRFHGSESKGLTTIDPSIHFKKATEASKPHIQDRTPPHRALFEQIKQRHLQLTGQLPRIIHNNTPANPSPTFQESQLKLRQPFPKLGVS